MDIYSMIKSHEDCPKGVEVRLDVSTYKQLVAMSYNERDQEWIEFLKRCSISEEHESSIIKVSPKIDKRG